MEAQGHCDYDGACEAQSDGIVILLVTQNANHAA